MQRIDVSTQKIDNSHLEIFCTIIASFLVDNKDGKSRFFEEIFLLAEVSIDIVFKISYLILSNVQIYFNN